MNLTLGSSFVRVRDLYRIQTAGPALSRRLHRLAGLCSMWVGDGFSKRPTAVLLRRTASIVR